jgi:CDP-diacylglycerol---serine O-phosphatidyltransferase
MSMSERPEEPNQASDADSLLPIDEHVEEGHDAEGRKVRHRGIYLLPNLFTTANLFAGFYSIINSMSAQSAMSAGDAAVQASTLVLPPSRFLWPWCSTALMAA